MTVYAYWHGGSNYSVTERDDFIERFDHLENAIEAFQTRYSIGALYPQSFNFINQDSDTCLCPVVDENASMEVWLRDQIDLSDCGKINRPFTPPFVRIVIRDGEGVIEEDL